MTEPALALQSAIRTRLINDIGVTALLAATSILDMNQRPSVMPCVLIGEGQTLPDDGLRRDRYEIHFDLHIWAMEAGTTQIKSIAGAIRDALSDRQWSIDGLEIADMYVESIRFLRDPDTIHAHAVMSLMCRVRETV